MYTTSKKRGMKDVELGDARRGQQTATVSPPTIINEQDREWDRWRKELRSESGRSGNTRPLASEEAFAKSPGGGWRTS